MSIKSISSSFSDVSKWVMEKPIVQCGLDIIIRGLALISIFNHKPSEECIKYKTIGNKEIKLIRSCLENNESDLYWSVFDKSNGRTKKYDAIEDYFETYSYHRTITSLWGVIGFIVSCSRFREELEASSPSYRDDSMLTSQDRVKVVRWLRGIPIRERISYFKDHDVVLDRNGSPELEKITAISKYNNVILDRDSWGVTLLCTGEDKIRGCLTGHAMIAVEGIKDGKKFINYGHASLNNKNKGCGGKVEFIDQEDEKIDEALQKHSETWMRSSELVNDMLNGIQREAKESHPFVFNFIGGKTIIGWIFERVTQWSLNPPKKHHNCLSWAFEKLAIAEIEAQSYNGLNFFVEVPAREIGGACVIV